MTVEDKRNERINHNVIMESRSKMMITGVTAVENFDEQSVCLETAMGLLTIKGSELKVDKLNVDTGELNVRGNILGLVYSDNTAKSGIFSRLFR